MVDSPIPLEESVLATARPINSVYGTDMSVLDTPRNITKKPTFDANYGYATATVDSEGLQQIEIDQNIASTLHSLGFPTRTTN